MPNLMVLRQTVEKIMDHKEGVIKDNIDKSTQMADSYSKKAARTLSDFFTSMKSKIVDLDEEVVKCEPKKNSIPKKPNPVFGLYMINPLLSSQTIQDKMIGKVPVPVSQVKRHLKSGDNSDWVVAGVLVNKSLPKISQKGSTFSIWKISDLKPGMNTITILLFGHSHADLWKIDIGFVVGILNPKEMDSKDKKDEISLSINSSDQVMVWGRSKDYGTCKVINKNGDKCDMFVNINYCDVCTFHVKQEYIKYCSQRANTGNSRPAAVRSLRDKVLAKNDVSYGDQRLIFIKSNNKKIKKEEDAKIKSLNSKKKHDLDQSDKNRKLSDDIVLDLDLEKKVAVEENISPRFLELMKVTSQNQDLIDTAQQEAEGMMNTYKMPCKAVYCLVCKYTWFSESEWCKTEKHVFRVLDATKRFFKCTNCNSRTACLTMFPMISCKYCNGSKWERAPMMG